VALYRAVRAAGEEPARYSFALFESPEVTALSDDDGVFYFSEGLARLPAPHVDALVAQAVAAHVSGAAGQRRAVSLGLTAGFTAGFTVLGVVLPGLSLADLVVNPLVVRAVGREHMLAADRKAVDVLAAMGHPVPRRMLAEALQAADANGPPRGGLLANKPELTERLAALEPLEAAPGVAARPR
jgi:hypothetical protein